MVGEEVKSVPLPSMLMMMLAWQHRQKTDGRREISTAAAATKKRLGIRQQQ